MERVKEREREVVEGIRVKVVRIDRGKEMERRIAEGVRVEVSTIKFKHHSHLLHPHRSAVSHTRHVLPLKGLHNVHSHAREGRLRVRQRFLLCRGKKMRGRKEGGQRR